MIWLDWFLAVSMGVFFFCVIIGVVLLAQWRKPYGKSCVRDFQALVIKLLRRMIAGLKRRSR